MTALRWVGATAAVALYGAALWMVLGALARRRRGGGRGVTAAVLCVLLWLYAVPALAYYMLTGASLWEGVWASLVSAVR